MKQFAHQAGSHLVLKTSRSVQTVFCVNARPHYRFIFLFFLSVFDTEVGRPLYGLTARAQRFSGWRFSGWRLDPGGALRSHTARPRRLIRGGSPARTLLDRVLLDRVLLDTICQLPPDAQGRWRTGRSPGS